MDPVLATIISALITGGLALIGVIITNMMSNRKIEYQMITSQAVTDTKIENLTNEVRKHNNFAQRIPVIEEQIKNLERRIDELEKQGN